MQINIITGKITGALSEQAPILQTYHNALENTRRADVNTHLDTFLAQVKTHAIEQAQERQNMDIYATRDSTSVSLPTEEDYIVTESENGEITVDEDALYLSLQEQMAALGHEFVDPSVPGDSDSYGHSEINHNDGEHTNGIDHSEDEEI